MARSSTELDETAAAPAPDESATAHVERILTIAEGRGPTSGDGELATSWRRSANLHRVDPDSGKSPRVLTASEVKGLREPLARLIVDAEDELDRLYGIVGQANYTVLLCNDRGVAVDHRGNEAEAEQFKYWGTWLGGVWAEDAEGTNGIGTCIAEKRAVTVHRTQHFRARHISLSCSGAPIFHDDGALLAVLDVSSIDPHLSEGSHALTGPLTEASSRAIEERSFRERFRSEWIVAVGEHEGAGRGMLLAVDRDHQIIGADRHARKLLAARGRTLEDGVSLWTLFEPNHAPFRRNNSADVAARLIVAGAPGARPALITPPDVLTGAWHNADTARLHTRPRLGVVAGLQLPEPPAPARGGLSPGASRRVQEYIEANLQDGIDLVTLADTAGLSLFHFARAFKQSEGMTPHAYVLERRLERAQQLLTGTNLSLSEVASATGFSDQGHLARHFRRRHGMSPRAVRWSMR
jgi:AraC-like DNA-binding protein